MPGAYCVIPRQTCFADLQRGNIADVTTHFFSRQITLPARADNLAALMKGRRSVRKFHTQPIPRELIEQILEAARWAPSPHGRQPWRFVVLTRSGPKIQLAERMGETWRENLEMDKQSAEIVTIRLEKSRQRILKAPAIILPCLYLEDLD